MSRPPPYFAQWESPELVPAILRGQVLAREDPAWAASGAATPEEYEWWGGRMCGVACLRSVLAAQGIAPPPSVTLAQELVAAGGYRHRDDGGLDGLIYAPFVRYLAERWSTAASVVAPLDLASLRAAIGSGALVMASVSPRIRRPDVDPPGRGGHLVLVHGCTDTGVVFHNPSGDTPGTQSSAEVTFRRFGAFFAGRGVVVHRSEAHTGACSIPSQPSPMMGSDRGRRHG